MAQSEKPSHAVRAGGASNDERKVERETAARVRVLRVVAQPVRMAHAEAQGGGARR